MSEQNFKQSVAARLKSIRSERNLSLDAVAKLTGVSKAMLGQIERGESSPTIAKLWQIVSGLETSFSAFFEQDQKPGAELDFPNDPHMKVISIFPYNKSVNFEMHKVTLTSHHCQKSQPHAHGVIESVIVLEGDMEVLVNGTWHLVECGGKFRFHADQPHGYRAVTEKAVFQNIVSY
ncbi:helix-turn-helix domain-containing protein [Vibrio salinus]|uniref:helix-turn-helix domain-containing protein n=1 Tax=Vibrio salinus TaxID=2899784 RepID=UPI001E64328A|nr:XRE family transcriptional regulator [Vibrio salinus]MCE0493130.1 XRE family transcriptional regulator [Vibrio salinus]